MINEFLLLLQLLNPFGGTMNNETIEDYLFANNNTQISILDRRII